MDTAVIPVEERFVLYDVSWKTYERLLADHENRSAPRFTYDHGALEIMSPLPEHERCNRALASLVEVVCMEWGIKMENLGSTTFKREELGRGFEPDSCFYLQNAVQVLGKNRIDLAVDPPPDLVIEIDLTHSSLDKLPIYAALQVPEIWRYDGQRVRVLVLREDSYDEKERSAALPAIETSVLTRFVEESKSLDRTAWLRMVLDWARQIAPGQEKQP